MKRYHLSRGSLLLIIVMVLTAGLWALLPVSNAEAGCPSSITVTKTSPDDNSAGTLRWAIGTVCPGGTIDFNLAYPATITLTNGTLGIDKDLTITGPGADKLTISGGGNVQVFSITSGSVHISGLTISNGVYHDSGGILNGGILTVTNSTFSGNSADSGGGGIFNNGSASLRNTIVANSTSGGNCGGPGTITSLGHNLEDTSPSTCNFTDSSDIVGSNPNLGSLHLNAPGTTETFALLAGSPAIDNADPVTFPSTDQRGVARPQGTGPDIGAYEYAPPTPVPAMDGWGIIIFIILAGLGSVYYLRRRGRAEG